MIKLSAHFSRRELARQYASELMGEVPITDVSSGLFLAGSRRTGKSEFLKEDLKEALADKGALVIYLDLWADPAKSSQTLISEAVGKAMVELQSAFIQKAKKEGAKEFSKFGFKFDISKIGATDGMTLIDALMELHKASKKKIALIIDEAQHALTSDEGTNAMFALKSARDQMRINSESQLIIVMSGSHKDKLASLTNHNAAPFYGANVRHMPTLGDAFAVDRARILAQIKPEFLSLSHKRMKEAFQHCQERPEWFIQRIQAAMAESGDLKQFEDRLLVLSQLTQEADQQAITERFQSLGDLQQAIVTDLLERGKSFKPFSKESIARYAKATGGDADSSAVQTAMDQLCKMERRNDPAIIWYSGRSSWSIYDQAMQEWFDYLKNAGEWPVR